MRTALLLFSLFLCLSKSQISLNFAASAPTSYDHSTGGGAWNDATKNEDIVESLEGGDFACFDYATFLLRIDVGASIPGGADDMHFKIRWSADPTGQSGVAFSDFSTTTQVNYGQVENGESKGKGNYGVDTAMSGNNDFGATLEIIDQTILVDKGNTPGPGYIFQDSAYLLADFNVLNIKPNNVYIVRFDVEIACLPGTRPTGNIQGGMVLAAVIDSTGKPISTINVGTQTVPLLGVGDVEGVAVCVPGDGSTIDGVEFKSDLTVILSDQTSVLYRNFAYSWPLGIFAINGSGLPTETYTFDSSCTFTHAGKYLLFRSTCGCEATNIGDDQPQFFVTYNNTAPNPPSSFAFSVGYWEYVGPTTYLGVQAHHYKSRDADTLTLTDIWVSTVWSTIGNTYTVLGVRWVNGMEFQFPGIQYVEDIAFAPVSTQSSDCTCRRAVDVALVLENGADISATNFNIQRDFAALFTTKFVIGSEDTMFAVMGFGSSFNVQLSISANPSNINASIYSLPYNPCSTKGGCTTIGGNVAEAIDGAAEHLRTKGRNWAGDAVVIISNGWIDADADVVAAAKRALSSNPPINVFVLAYQSHLRTVELAYATGNFTDRVFNRYLPEEVIAEDPVDIASSVCAVSENSCGSFCTGYCDQACGKCLPVDDCVPPTHLRCNETYIINEQGGNCAVGPGDQCTDPELYSQCKHSVCDPVNDVCIEVNDCNAPDLCTVASCVADANSDTGYSCILTPKVRPGDLSCTISACDPLTGKITNTTRNCDSLDDGCSKYTCVEGKGCVFQSSYPPPDPCKQTCVPASGDKPAYWTDKPCPYDDTDKCTTGSYCVNIDGQGVCKYNVSTCPPPVGKCINYYCDSATGNCITNKTECGEPKPCQTSPVAKDAETGYCIKSTGKCAVFTDVICTSNDCSDKACNSTTSTCEVVDESRCECTCTNDACVFTDCVPATSGGTPSCGVTQNRTFPAIENGNECRKLTGCDPATGPVYEDTDCTILTPDDDCHYYVADPAAEGCCVQMSKEGDCVATSLCFDSYCNVDGGSCEESYLCVDDFSECSRYLDCSASEGCVYRDFTCPDETPCFRYECIVDATEKTRTCVPVDKCSEGHNNLCETPYCFDDGSVQECRFNTTECLSDGACGIATCNPETGDCQISRRNCDDGIACTADSCDVMLGCINTPIDQACNTSNPCETFQCTLNGCIYGEVFCADGGNTNNCTEMVCVDYEGCKLTEIVCNASLYGVGNGDCSLVLCDEDSGDCVVTPVACVVAVSSGLIAGATLGIAAIIGIVIALVVFLAGAGGGAYAAVNSLADSGAHTVSDNPLFTPAGQSVTNSTVVN